MKSLWGQMLNKTIEFCSAVKKTCKPNLMLSSLLVCFTLSCLGDAEVSKKSVNKRVEAYTWIDDHNLLGMERNIPLSLFYGKRPVDIGEELDPDKYEIIRVSVYDYGKRDPSGKEGLLESFKLADLGILIGGKDVREIPAVVKLTREGPKIVNTINTRPVGAPETEMLVAVVHMFLIRRPRDAELRIVYSKQPKKLTEFALNKEDKDDREFLYSLLMTRTQAMSALMKQLMSKKPTPKKSLK